MRVMYLDEFFVCVRVSISVGNKSDNKIKIKTYLLYLSQHYSETLVKFEICFIDFALCGVYNGRKITPMNLKLTQICS